MSNLHTELKHVVYEFTKTNFTYVLEECILVILLSNERFFKSSQITKHNERLIEAIRFWLKSER